jgi:hypothetical protein
MGDGRARNWNPGALWEFPIRLLGFAAVSGGTAFAFAGVFSFAGMGALRVRHRLKSDSRILTLIHPSFDEPLVQTEGDFLNRCGGWLESRVAPFTDVQIGRIDLPHLESLSCARYIPLDVVGV